MGIIFSSSASILLITVHIIYLSLHIGTIWPDYANGYFAAYYTNYVVQPLLNFFQLGIVNVGLSILVWSIIGGGLYALVEIAIASFRSDYKNETSLQIVNNRLVAHPQHRYLLTKLIWRLVVGGIIVLFLYIALPFARLALHLDYKVVADNTLTSTVADLAAGFLVWFVLINLGVILLRLYVRRSRLLGN